MQLKLSFLLLQKLKFDEIHDTILVKSGGITIETMDVDVKMVKKVFRCQAAVFTILNTPTMSQSTIRVDGEPVAAIGEAQGTGVTDILGFVVIVASNDFVQTPLHELISFPNKGESLVESQVIIVVEDTEVFLREGNRDAAVVQQIEISDTTDELSQKQAAQWGVEITVFVGQVNSRIALHLVTNVVPLLRMVLLKEVKQFVTLHVLRDMEREGQISLELRLPSEAVFVDERICPSLKGIDGLLGVVDAPVI